MNKEVTGSLLWAGFVVMVALCASFARRHGYIDGETTTRLVAGAIGIMTAAYGNQIPKAFVPNVRASQARRVAGWSMVLSGLLYAALWAFAPIPVAVKAGTGAIVAGMVVTLGYCLTLREKAKAV